MGLVGETGELVDWLKKVRFHGHSFDLGKLEDEVGDILWYVSASLSSSGLTFRNLIGHNSIARYDSNLGPDQGDVVCSLTTLALHISKCATSAAVRIDRSLILDRDQLLVDLREVVGRSVRVLLTAGTTMVIVLEKNIAKLKARFPKGFEAEKSKVRDRDEEQRKQDEV